MIRVTVAVLLTCLVSCGSEPWPQLDPRWFVGPCAEEGAMVRATTKGIVCERGVWVEKIDCAPALVLFCPPPDGGGVLSFCCASP